MTLSSTEDVPAAYTVRRGKEGYKKNDTFRWAVFAGVRDRSCRRGLRSATGRIRRRSGSCRLDAHPGRPAGNIPRAPPAGTRPRIQAEILLLPRVQPGLDDLSES